MNDLKLQEDLKKLRREVQEIAAGDDEARQQLDLLISDIEKRIQMPADANGHKNLLQGIRDAIGQLEAEHPRVTGILNDIMTTLGNMGI
jgi:hypothetical protein